MLNAYFNAETKSLTTWIKVNFPFWHVNRKYLRGFQYTTSTQILSTSMKRTDPASHTIQWYS